MSELFVRHELVDQDVEAVLHGRLLEKK